MLRDNQTVDFISSDMGTQLDAWTQPFKPIFFLSMLTLL